MEFIIITGGLGQGKTLYMTYLAHKYEAENKWPILSNYPVTKKQKFLAESPKIYAVDEIHRTPNFWKVDEIEGVFICTAFKKEFIAKKDIPENVTFIEVKREGNEIVASNGDRVNIEDYIDKYNSLVMPAETLVIGEYLVI